MENSECALGCFWKMTTRTAWRMSWDFMSSPLQSFLLWFLTLSLTWSHWPFSPYSCMTHVDTDRRQKNRGQTAQMVATTFRWKVFNYFWWCCNYFDDIKKPLLSCLSSQSWYFSVNYLLVSHSVKRLDRTREGAWTAANIYCDCQLFLMTFFQRFFFSTFFNFFQLAMMTLLASPHPTACKHFPPQLFPTFSIFFNFF